MASMYVHKRRIERKLKHEQQTNRTNVKNATFYEVSTGVDNSRSMEWVKIVEIVLFIVVNNKHTAWQTDKTSTANDKHLPSDSIYATARPCDIRMCKLKK